MADYGPAHREQRQHWTPIVATGKVVCTRHGHPQFTDCPGIIQPADDWELGHDDTNPNRWTGPEHRHCNRKAGGLKRTRQLLNIDLLMVDDW